jgi:anthranilate synthase/aminodeoxychorismate synthase-like glutamine amidotransferase
MVPMILVLDNFDSFVHNLARYLQRLGQATQVVRNDAIDVAGVRQLRPQALVLSPGPCTPREAGCSLDLVRHLHGELPILGVCLGHQVIGEALGGRVVRAPLPMHGRTSLIQHAGQGLFAGLPSPLSVCRYHSLVVERESLPPTLQVTAQTTDGVVMALAHRGLPVHGVQFHPEAILTDGGYEMLSNFLRAAKIPVPGHAPGIDAERPLRRADAVLGQSPITF